MNSPVTCVEVPPRQPQLAVVPRPIWNTLPEPPEDELRRLAFEIVQRDPVLAQLLLRAGERVRRN
jgi:hypothetical protein